MKICCLCCESLDGDEALSMALVPVSKSDDGKFEFVETISHRRCANEGEHPLRFLDTEVICEALVRHMEFYGEELFEKWFEKYGKKVCAVYCMVGPNVEKFVATVGAWLSINGFKRTR